MDIKPIKTKRDYEAALRAIEPLMSAKRNTPEGDRLDVLVTSIEAYEHDISRLISPTRSKPSSS